ncbi:MAG: hypothetical protein R2939_01555 [Kofleriaceae bacterium]
MARDANRPSPEQLERYRAMSPAQRYRQACALNWTARRLRLAHERALHPDWDDATLAAHVRRIFLRAAT